PGAGPGFPGCRLQYPRRGCPGDPGAAGAGGESGAAAADRCRQPGGPGCLWGAAAPAIAGDRTVSAFAKLKARHDPTQPLVAMSASGQLGYGVVASSFEAGIARKP